MNDLIFTLLPVIIFFARILDVSIGTLRIVFLSKGLKKWVPVLGFLEVLIWILVVGKLMGAEGIGLIHYVSYALGFATGNYVGILIEEKISMGDFIVRIFMKDRIEKFREELNKRGIQYTLVKGEGEKGEMKIFFLIIERKKAKALLKFLKEFDKNIFYSVEEVKEISRRTGEIKQPPKRFFGLYRRGK